MAYSSSMASIDSIIRRVVGSSSASQRITSEYVSMAIRSATRSPLEHALAVRRVGFGDGAVHHLCAGALADGFKVGREFLFRGHIGLPGLDAVVAERLRREGWVGHIWPVVLIEAFGGFERFLRDVEEDLLVPLVHLERGPWDREQFAAVP